MKGNKLVILVLTAITVGLMLVAGCSPAPTTPTPSNTPTVQPPTPTQPAATTTPTPTVIEKDKSYNFLSPRGIALPVTIKALAKRPASLDGLTVYICQGEADPVIMPALSQIAPQKNPKTTWVYFNPVSGFGPAAPEDEVKQKANAVVRGISW